MASQRATLRRPPRANPRQRQGGIRGRAVHEVASVLRPRASGSGLRRLGPSTSRFQICTTSPTRVASGRISRRCASTFDSLLARCDRTGPRRRTRDIGCLARQFDSRILHASGSAFSRRGTDAQCSHWHPASVRTRPHDDTLGAWRRLSRSRTCCRGNCRGCSPRRRVRTSNVMRRPDFLDAHQRLAEGLTISP